MADAEPSLHGLDKRMTVIERVFEDHLGACRAESAQTRAALDGLSAGQIAMRAAQDSSLARLHRRINRVLATLAAAALAGAFGVIGWLLTVSPPWASWGGP